jgi:ankyrin repeat protein
VVLLKEPETAETDGTAGTAEHTDHGKDTAAGPAGPPLNAGVRTTTDPDKEYPGEMLLDIWLLKATERCFIYTMQVLLQHGAPIDRSEKVRQVLGNKMQLLSIAVGNGCTHALGVLLSHLGTFSPYHIEVALAFAITIGDLPCTDMLLQYCPWSDIWIPSDNLGTPEVELPPISYAVEKGNYELLDVLLCHFNIDELDYTSCPTPLIRAIRNRDINMVAYLLENGASVNPRWKKLPLPLGEAAARGFGEIVHMLLEWGAELDGCDHKGLTALDRALVAPQPDMVKALLELGADVNPTTFRVITIYRSVVALQILLANRRYIYPGLIAYGLCEAVSAGVEGMVIVFLQHSTPLEHIPTGRHCLHLAGATGNLKIISMLMQVGYGFTPELRALALGAAIVNKRFAAVNLLLDFGANPNMPTYEWPSALHAAVSTKNLALVKLLLARGACADLDNGCGFSVLHVAVHLRCEEIIDFLEEHLKATGKCQLVKTEIGCGHLVDVDKKGKGKERDDNDKDGNNHHNDVTAAGPSHWKHSSSRHSL